MWIIIVNFLSEWYLWIKALHIISIITWMAGLFYLPRLFVYHCEGHDRKGVVFGSNMDLLFQKQERLLLKAIMNPAMIATWIFGLCLLFTPGIIDWSEIWPYTKGVSVLIMSYFHHWLALRRKDFLENKNQLSGKNYRIINEVPTILLIIIVFSVVLKF